MTELLVALRRHLASLTDVTAMLGSTQLDPWIWRNRLMQPVEGTASRALVLVRRGSWATSNIHNTAQFPSVAVMCYSDTPRNLIEPGPTSTDSYTSACETLDIVDHHLHRMDGGFFWDDLRIVSSKRLADITPVWVQDGDGLVVLQRVYSVTL